MLERLDLGLRSFLPDDLMEGLDTKQGTMNSNSTVFFSNKDRIYVNSPDAMHNAGCKYWQTTRFTKNVGKIM